MPSTLVIVLRKGILFALIVAMSGIVIVDHVIFPKVVFVLNVTLNLKRRIYVDVLIRKCRTLVRQLFVKGTRQLVRCRLDVRVGKVN